jgi:hypothetical protein
MVDLGLLRLVAHGALIIALFLWVPRGVIPTMGSALTKRRRRGPSPLHEAAEPERVEDV